MILIDDREGSRDLVDTIALHDLSVLTRLESGDCSFEGLGNGGLITRIGIEVKTISDLVSSARTTRLQKQLVRMRDEYDTSWVLYYGIFRPSPKSKGILLYHETTGKWRLLKLGRWRVPYSYLQSITVRISELGVSVFHVATKENVSQWVAQIYRCCQKPPEKQTFMRTFMSTLGSKKSNAVTESKEILRVARVASGFNGINYARGVEAARYFGSVFAMINASEREWRNVNGIGGATASSVYRQIRRGL